jgi:hypothetical protein
MVEPPKTLISHAQNRSSVSGVIDRSVIRELGVKCIDHLTDHWYHTTLHLEHGIRQFQIDQPLKQRDMHVVWFAAEFTDIHLRNKLLVISD